MDKDFLYDLLHSLHPTFKHVVDGLAIGSSLIGAFLATLPVLTMLVSFLWLLLRVYETILNIRKLRRQKE